MNTTPMMKIIMSMLAFVLLASSVSAFMFERPELTRPQQLFDIRLELAEQELASTDPLIATTRFESFGTVPTPVNLTYRIIQDSVTLHDREGRIVVESELVVTETFEGLSLGPGSYTLVLTTVYGNGIEDDFRQSFTITAPEIERSVPALWAVFVITALLAVFATGYLLGNRASHRSDER